VNRSMRFAPLSGGPSARLRFVVWYFAVTGGLMLVFLVFGLAHAAVVPGSGNRAALMGNPFGPALAIVFCGVVLLVAWLLHHGRREGAILAALLLLRSVAGALLGGQWLTLDMALDVIGLVLIASIWGELQPFARSKVAAERRVT
jgi:hypothetical protein